MDNVHQFPALIDPVAQMEDSNEGKRIKRKRLINKLNAINFKNATVRVNFKHIKFNHNMIILGKPLPCYGDDLECVWAEPVNLCEDLNAYQFLNILVPDGPQQILITSESVCISQRGLTIHLPESSIVINRRKAQRYRCKDVKVRLIQNSAEFCGVLIEFCPFSFFIEIHQSPPQTFQWIDPNQSATVIFGDEENTYYSGICKILKQSEGIKTRNYVLEPLENYTRRFKPREFRCTRQELLPLPNVIFRHPLTKKIENLKVFDLSGSGLAVLEDKDNSVLLPGMIIPELQIDFAGSLRLVCKAQVVYRKKLAAEDEKEGCLRYGLAILDMDLDEHRKLTSLLYQATDSKSYLSNQVDMEALWDFFFESGFIYPQKYNFLLENKDHIKETYEKLYNSNPSIARHFIYQERGRILGHMSMLRFYNNSWLIQHHAADNVGSGTAGLAVLNQVHRFINDSHTLYSAHMDFVLCYYRPENKFPERVFGGVYRNTKNPRICSIDRWAYFHYRKTVVNRVEEQADWMLEQTQPRDLVELKRFYEYSSGGLMLSALELDSGLTTADAIAKEFHRLGFKRERYLFSLKKNNRLKAIFIANVSDLGLNFSDLTNCIQAITLDPETLPQEVFYGTLAQIASKFDKDEVPVLLYPVAYAENRSIPYEKTYCLWVFDLQHIDYYLRYLKQLLKHLQH